MSTQDNINDFVEISWKTFLNQSIENFEKKLENEDVEESFNEEYVKSVSTKLERFNSIYIKLSITYYTLLSGLFYSLGKDDGAGFTLLGFSVKNIYDVRGLIIIVISILAPVGSLLYLHSKYLKKVAETVLKKSMPKEASDYYKYYKYKYFDSVLDFDWFRYSDFDGYPHSITKLSVLFFVLTLVCFAVLLSAIPIFMSIAVVWDLIQNPVATNYLNVIILIMLTVSILFSISITILQLPLPIISYDNIGKLNKLQEEDESQYRKIMLAIRKKHQRKEFHLNSAIFLFLYITTIMFITYDFNSHKIIYESYLVFFLILVGSLIGNALSHKIVSWLSKRLRLEYGKKHYDSKDRQYQELRIMSRKLFATKISVPLVVTIIACGFLKIFAK